MKLPLVSTPNAHCHQGLVVSSSGRHCLVEMTGGERLLCHPRGKKTAPIVGDWVEWSATEDEGVINAVLPRSNLLYRQDEMRTKTFAANLDLLLFFVAAEPEFSEWQLSRALISAEQARIPVHIVLNKADLGGEFARALQRLAPYSDMGYGVHGLSVKNGLASPEMQTLTQLLQGKTTLIIGPSGSGKSSFINLLAPGAVQATREISQALQSGKHTTSATTLHWIQAPSTGQTGTALIDSPGFQEFGLHHIAPTELAGLMPDMAKHLGACKFYNCSHIHEPGCGVRAQLGLGLSPARHEMYQKIWQELSQAPRYA